MVKIKVRVLTTPKTKTLTKESSSSNIQNAVKSRKESSAGDTRRRLLLLAAKVVFLVVLFTLCFFVVFGTSRMHDSSMYPSVHDGDFLVYYRMENQFSNGDIVVADRGSGEEVYRIIASGGQLLDIDEEKGGLTIDGQPSTYEAFYETNRAEKTMFKYPYKVSPDCYFVLNDYRSNTNDSRTFGEVCKSQIKGRLITKIQIKDF